MAAKYAPRHVRRRDWAGIKLTVVALLFGATWLVLWGRAFQVQVLMGDELARMAKRQHLASEFISGERGRIFDSQGRMLAQSVQSRSIYARPMDVKDSARVSRELGRILGIPRSQVAGKLKSTRPFVWLSRQVNDREASLVEALELPGIELVDEYKRFYPNGHLAGQLLGFNGYDGQGLEGLERSLQLRLVGKKDKTIVQRDARGRKLYLDGSEDSDDVRGEDVHLTIDADIQAVAEQALEKAVVRNKGSNGTGLVIEVATGEIKAWAQYPFFNPNIYGQYRPSSWRNRIALDALEPGSTLKPFVIAAALQEKAVTRDSSFDCENGKWEMRGATIRDTHEYGILPVHKILRYSSNIGAAKIGLELGASRLHGYLSKLGFGARPGLDLPGESKGILREPGAWQKVDLANISFGQGMSATPLQVARGYLCLARKGVMVPLKLLKGEQSQEPERKVFDVDVAREVLSMMRDVVEEDGTGRVARIDGIDVGGKTGTAQKASAKGGYGDKYVASFVGLIPAGEPEYLVLVMVDEPEPNHYGSVVAAPAVREIAIQTLAFLGKLPEPAAEAVLATAARSGKDGTVRRSALGMHEKGRMRTALRQAGSTVPDVVGLSLRRAVEILATAGTVPDFEGEGVVVRRQDPKPGRAWPDGSKRCVLWLGKHPGRS
ncbi:penicillin-binding transpeptidase domain-containing protein [Desulfovibrio ferrophilus]|uniref:Peptidoglycan glycosyltransferase n=1 Tax=Desulfovibrio ferrophilus TaxID=241368 RepID=A0A2Z6AZD6_9BACT|nr:penicillin-binding transpeptidase domain-containing protein [Desulfovibrio ferrophilus]BBD08550.1 peptidoglycan glycosyltransferase [Desulfovibrio ferrophilus]